MNIANGKQKVLVIGGGIIGVTSALNLLKRGYSVTLIDKEAIAAGASTGNCGLMAVGEVVPIAKPGILSQVPKWLMDPNGPVAIRPLHALTILPWLARFLKSGSKANVSTIANGLTQLSNHAAESYEPLLKESHTENLLKPHEVIYLFENNNEIASDSFSWNLRRDCGFETEYLNGNKLRELEPEISEKISCGMLMKGWNFFSDPERLTKALSQLFVEQGGEIRFGEVVDFIGRKENQLDAVLLANGEKILADEFVLATGAWSSTLASRLGDRVPVEAMAGYNTTIAKPNVKIKHPLLYHNGGFVMTPMDMGLRVAGTLELGGLNSKPNDNRMNSITCKAKKILPKLELVEKTEWVGYRPMTPDTLPVISRSPNCINMTYACGHGQLGITYGAITGELVGDIVQKGFSDKVDISAYSANRF